MLAEVNLTYAYVLVRIRRILSKLWLTLSLYISRVFSLTASRTLGSLTFYSIKGQ